MQRFSQRMGFKPVKSVIQKDSMDDDLRNGLWNTAFKIYFRYYSSYAESLDEFTENLWVNFYKIPIDMMDLTLEKRIKTIRFRYYDFKWYEVYDFIEFVANNTAEKYEKALFIKECNKVLEKELSAYRFVGRLITEITSDKEITEIEQGLDSPLEPVKTHLKQALDLYANRKNPDYRNSIKESVSAVEAICRLIAKNNKATLTQALREIEKAGSIELHPALKDALDKLYGYTSDTKDGIRHAMKDKPDINPEDARFMLVSCSAFINYLTEKATKAGIKL